MPHVNMLANTVMDAHESAHEKDRNTHADEVKEVLRDVKALRMSAPVFSGRLAVGVVLGGLLWAAATSALAQGLPQHMVAYMTGPGQTECPNNWTEAAYAQGRLILGTTDGSKIQKLAGTPASNAQPPQHVHTFTVTGTVDSQSNSALPGGGIPRAAAGEVNSSGATQGTALALPFIQFLVCEQTATESPDSAPYGTVAFSTRRPARTIGQRSVKPMVAFSCRRLPASRSAMQPRPPGTRPILRPTRTDCRPRSAPSRGTMRPFHPIMSTLPIREPMAWPEPRPPRGRCCRW